jgi:hypothetical protein
MVMMALFLSILLAPLTVKGAYEDGHSKSQKDKDKEWGEEEEGGTLDYHLYDLMDQVAKAQLPEIKRPEGSTPGDLYAFLGLREETASGDHVSSVFRRLSLRYHPDKHREDPKARHLYQLVTGVADVLRQERVRRRYLWLRHQAPAWHRSSVMLRHTFFHRRHLTANFSLSQSLLITAILVLGGEYLARILWWTWHAGHRLLSRRQLARIGGKELKRMRRKLDKLERSASATNLLSSNEHHHSHGHHYDSDDSSYDEIAMHKQLGTGNAERLKAVSTSSLMSRIDDQMEVLVRAEGSLPPFPRPLPWMLLLRLLSWPGRRRSAPPNRQASQ